MYTNALTDLSIPPQSYADLLKASWILIDILANPQLKRSPIGEYYQVQMLAKVRELRPVLDEPLPRKGYRTYQSNAIR